MAPTKFFCKPNGYAGAKPCVNDVLIATTDSAEVRTRNAMTAALARRARPSTAPMRDASRDEEEPMPPLEDAPSRSDAR